MRDALSPPPVAGLPLAGDAKAKRGPAPAGSRRAKIVELCRQVLALGREAPSGSWHVGASTVAGTRITDSDGLPILTVLGDSCSADLETRRRSVAVAQLAARYRNAAPILAAELLGLLEKEGGPDVH
jgi:hypothetical protein